MIRHNNLEEFQDPANYDLEEAERVKLPIAFYGKLAKTIGEPILEIACGTGLVTIPIAEQGFAVTGVDVCRPMLEYARYKALRCQLSIRWVEADARQLKLGEHFKLIYITGNAFQAFLQRQDQESLLSTVRNHLSPGGTFAFETRNPSGHDLKTYCEEVPWYSYTNLQGQIVSVSGTQRYDPIHQIIHWSTYRRWHEKSGTQLKKTRIACRFTYPQELSTLLYYNGFRILRQFGDWDKGALTSTSPTIITISVLR